MTRNTSENFFPTSLLVTERDNVLKERELLFMINNFLQVAVIKEVTGYSSSLILIVYIGGTHYLKTSIYYPFISNSFRKRQIDTSSIFGCTKSQLELI